MKTKEKKKKPVKNPKMLASLGGEPVRSEFLVFGAPQILEDEIREVVHTLKSGWLSTGPKTELFESRFKEFIGSKYAIALNSCTAGLHLALEALGVGPGDEVITSPLTFVATANVIIHRGATPVFADIDKMSMNIDPYAIRKKITRRTKAVIPVHFAGRPCEMDEIIKIARQNKLFCIDDAAHATEAWYRNEKIGNIADMSCFSFYVTKNIATGEGGMITTNNRRWAQWLKIARLHGLSRNAWKRYLRKGFAAYDVLYPGFKYNMMDIQAALGIHQLARVIDNLKLREKYWRMYDEAFRDVGEIILPPEEKGITHARHLYTILLRLEKLKCDRNQFAAALQAEHIGIGIHFLSLHLFSYYRKRFGYKRGDYPNAEFISDRTISIPLSAGLTEDDVRDVIKAVKKVIHYYRK